MYLYWLDLLGVCALPMAYMFSVGCCCVDPCGICTTDTTPLQIQLDFDDVDNSACAGCNDFNTTSFILDQFAVGPPCQWRYSGSLPCSGETDPPCGLGVQFTDLSGTFAFIVQVFRDNPSTGACWTTPEADMPSLSGAVPRNCSVNLIGDNMDNGAGRVHCLWSSASPAATVDIIML